MPSSLHSVIGTFSAQSEVTEWKYNVAFNNYKLMTNSSEPESFLRLSVAQLVKDFPTLYESESDNGNAGRM
jgi:hypothetical protein